MRRSACLAASIICTLFNTAVFADGTPSKAFNRWLLREMQQNQVPGVSIAVVRDYKIEWAMGYGYANVKTEDPVTEQTIFQAGSISKPVTAMAVLKAVQDHKLNLDDDVNQFLTSWKIPESKFTEDYKVTVAELLSHSAGINIPGFFGYASTDKIPTLLEILEGTAPAQSPPIRVIASPGARYEYSGGGYTILQQIMVDTYKKPFDSLMDEMILQPLGMTRSTFKQPLPSDLADQIALAYRPGYESVEGGPHIYPEQAAAGLWTTPFDLAKFMISLQAAVRGQSNQILNPIYARDMITKQIDHMGLGFMVNMNKYGQPSPRGRYFMHGGQNEGYKNLMVGSINGGYGMIIMTNMTPDSKLVANGKAQDSWKFIQSVEQRVADMEGWK